MRQTIRWILVSVVACAIGSLVSYPIAHHRGYESGYKNGAIRGIQHSAFGQSAGFFATLQQLRAGDIARATRLVETLCFNSAHIFYKQPTPNPAEASQWAHAQGLDRSPDAVMIRDFAQELSKYRATYRSNGADWDTMEQKLELELIKVK